MRRLLSIQAVKKPVNTRMRSASAIRNAINPAPTPEECFTVGPFEGVAVGLVVVAAVSVVLLAMADVVFTLVDGVVICEVVGLGVLVSVFVAGALELKPLIELESNVSADVMLVAEALAVLAIFSWSQKRSTISKQCFQKHNSKPSLVALPSSWHEIVVDRN